jgi:HTH-type transcriptional regulator/antitoxin HipB
MVANTDLLPTGNVEAMRQVIRSSEALGRIARQQRRSLKLNQSDVAGLGNTGNRFIGDLEQGKPTLQLQKVLDTLDLLGLEVVVQAKSTGMP